MLKAGDRVECVLGCGDSLVAGREYTVVRFDGAHVFVGSGQGWHPDRFKLVNPEPEAKPIPISNIPEGWEVVRIGAVKEGEHYLSVMGQALKAESDVLYPRIVIKQKALSLSDLKAGQKFRFLSGSYEGDEFEFVDARTNGAWQFVVWSDEHGFLTYSQDVDVRLLEVCRERS